MVIPYIPYDEPIQGSFQTFVKFISKGLSVVELNLANKNLSSLGGNSGGGRVLLGRGVGLLVLVGGSIDIVLLSGAVNGDLDRNGATVNVLAVHLADGLGLELLGSQVDESEATGLAALVASLQLLDHETGDGTEGNLGRNGRVVGEDFLELNRRNLGISTMAGLDQSR